MGKESESRKRFNNSRTRTPSQNGRQRTFSQSGYNDFRAKRNRTRSPGRRQDQQYQGRSRTPSRNQPFPPVRCIGCRCNSCYSNKKTLQEIKELLSKKLDVKLVGQDPPANVNLCDNMVVPEEMVINYTYTDQGRQIMILDLRAPVSVARVPG